jgi:hypothetical protein
MKERKERLMYLFLEVLLLKFLLNPEIDQCACRNSSVP